jgi:hypothetical protein
MSTSAFGGFVLALNLDGKFITGDFRKKSCFTKNLRCINIGPYKFISGRYVMMYRAIIIFLGNLFLVSSALAQVCVDCHKKVTPNIVSDWQLSQHSKNEVDCSDCHGGQHSSAQDVDKVRIPTPETCADCHETQVRQFKGGKHAFAWAAMKAMPTAHWQPMALMEGMKGCGGCHKIGLKTEAEISELKKNGAGFGTASCDACHTRHPYGY